MLLEATCEKLKQFGANQSLDGQKQTAWLPITGCSPRIFGLSLTQSGPRQVVFRAIRPDFAMDAPAKWHENDWDAVFAGKAVAQRYYLRSGLVTRLDPFLRTKRYGEIF